MFRAVSQDLLLLSALVHDIGKSNQQFQAMLRQESGAQRMRHDVLGACLLGAAIAKAGQSDEAWLSASLDPAQFFDVPVQADWAKPGSGPLDRFIISGLLGPAARQKIPLGLGLTWLVLTHHRLIGAVGDTASLSNYINAGLELSADNLAVTDEPWGNPSWTTAWRDVVGRLLTTVRSAPNSVAADPDFYFSTLLYRIRPNLLIGDALASAMQEDVLKGADECFLGGVAYANTQSNRLLPGDRLTSHLTSAAANAGAVASLQASYSFPVLSIGSLPADSLLHLHLAGSKFAWQEEAANAIQAVPDITIRPFFAALFAEPGSGKTAAGPRVLSAASNKQLRFSLALGLRSLTLQTASAYRSQLKIPEDSLATVIGGGPQFFSKEEAGLAGSESLLDGEEDDFEVAHHLPPPWVEQLQPKRKLTRGSPVFSEKLIRMIDAAVVVCTVDHLVPAAAMLKSKSARLMLRISSSDLILDELDNYSSADLVALSRLVYLYGRCGRRVVLMSGTMPAELVAMFYESWRLGITHFQVEQGGGAEPVAALVANRLKPQVIADADGSKFREAVISFCQDLGDAIEAVGSKVMPAIAHITPSRVEESVVQACLELHQKHSVLDSRSGKPFSVGFVRMNSVGNAQALATHLFNRPQAAGEPLLRITCYHSRHSALTRAVMERVLESALNRKTRQVPNLPEVESALAIAPPQGVIWLVCTTSILDTGRDFDFDWAVLEPSTERAAVQAAGRILRHRDKVPHCPNIAVMHTTVRGLAGKKNPYAYHGVQDEERFQAPGWLVTSPGRGSPLAQALSEAGIGYTAAPAPVTSLNAIELLPVFNKKYLTTAGCLLSPRIFHNAPISSLVHLDQLSKLSSVSEFLRSGTRRAGQVGWLDERHAVQFRFREDGGAQLSVYPDGSAFKAKTELGSKPSSVKWTFTELHNIERDMLRMDVTRAIRIAELLKDIGVSLCASESIDKVSIPYSEPTYFSGLPVFEFNPCLGFKPL